MFTTTLREIDGTYAVSVPADVVKDLNLREGSALDVSVEGQNLILKPQRKSRYTLEELLAQCDFSVPMSEEDREWVNAPRVGRELI